MVRTLSSHCWGSGFNPFRGPRELRSHEWHGGCLAKAATTKKIECYSHLIDSIHFTEVAWKWTSSISEVCLLWTWACGHLLFMARWSEAQVITCTCDWPLKGMPSPVRWALNLWHLTITLNRIGLNCRTPSWGWQNVWCGGRINSAWEKWRFSFSLNVTYDTDSKQIGVFWFLSFKLIVSVGYFWNLTW